MCLLLLLLLSPALRSGAVVKVAPWGLRAVAPGSSDRVSTCATEVVIDPAALVVVPEDDPSHSLEVPALRVLTLRLTCTAAPGRPRGPGTHYALDHARSGDRSACAFWVPAVQTGPAPSRTRTLC